MYHIHWAEAECTKGTLMQYLLFQNQERIIFPIIIHRNIAHNTWIPIRICLYGFCCCCFVNYSWSLKSNVDQSPSLNFFDFTRITRHMVESPKCVFFFRDINVEMKFWVYADWSMNVNNTVCWIPSCLPVSLPQQSVRRIRWCCKLFDLIARAVAWLCVIFDDELAGVAGSGFVGLWLFSL